MSRSPFGPSRRRRPVRAGHIEGGSRWCYNQGCGHPDCYRAEAYYSWRRRHPGAEPNFGAVVVAEATFS